MFSVLPIWWVFLSTRALQYADSKETRKTSLAKHMDLGLVSHTLFWVLICGLVIGKDYAAQFEESTSIFTITGLIDDKDNEV